MANRIGYAAGAFDLFHIGHLNILRQAKECCDFLIAGVVSDELCNVTKGRYPVIPLAERLEIVHHIDFVDRAVADVHPNRINTWSELGFDIFFKGNDWEGTGKGLKLEREFAEVGVDVVYFPYTLHTSSSLLRRTIEAMNVLTAAVPGEAH